MKRKALTHRVLLQGKDVSTRFAVGAMPTGFWIDRDGVIVDFVVGFVDGDEAKLEARARKLLAK